MNQNRIYFVGHAQLPKNIPAYEVYGTIAVGLEIDMDTAHIVNASSNLATELAQNIIASCLIDQDISQGIKHVIALVERKYQGDAQRAIVMAIRNAYNRYREFIDKPPSTSNDKD